MTTAIVLICAIGAPLVAITFAYLKHNARQLKEFRAGLKVGVMVRYQRADGQLVRGRIVRRESARFFMVVDLDNRNRYTTDINNIFRP